MIEVHERRLLVILLVWSILVHLSFALLIGPPDFWDHYEGRQYRNIAESLVEGRGYREPITSMPLYSLTLAGLLELFGYASLPLLLLHVVFGVTTTFFTYRIGRAIFSPGVGLLAGLLISVHPYLLKLTMQIIDTGPSVALTTLSMWLLMRAWLDSCFKARRYVWAGAAFALATLVRPVGAIAIAVLGAGIFVWYLVQQAPRRAIAAVVALWLTWAAVMSPWWIRNYGKYGQFILLTTHGGVNLHKGHTAYYNRVHPIYDTDHYPYRESIEVEEEDPSGALTGKAYTLAALSYVREHPVEAITADLQKIVWLYTWHKVPRSLVNSSPRWDPDLKRVVDDGNPRAAPQDIVYSIYWIPVLLLFLVGLVTSRRRWQRLIPCYLIVIANALSVAMAFADTRYRLEIDPYVVIWAAYGLTSLMAGLGRFLGGWAVSQDSPKSLIF
jgi:4-amino-4-deoxy-L-arabinose transferase-like glycosyltransferase